MKTKYIITILAIAITTTNTFAQETQQNQTQASSTSTSSENDDKIKSLENIVSKLPKISGLVNLRHQYSDENKNYASGKNGFDVRRVYLDFRGNLSKQLTYRIQLDFAGTPKVLDAFTEWKPSKYIGIQAGQYKVPYTLENPYSPTNLETADNSQVITALITDVAGNKNNGRDIGLSINGSFFQKTDYNIIDYKLGVFNGNIINSTDNNTTKDIVGTLLINPIKSLTFSASYYQGEFGVQASKFKHNRTSFGARFDNSKLLFRAEYVEGAVGNSIASLKDANGYYATAAYYVTKKIQPVLKYDFYQADKSNNNSATTNYVFGLNYWLNKTSRVQVNYTFRDFKDSAQEDGNYVVTQLLIGF